ncbi:hypothetical protein [Pseudomonas sp. REST10]|uniref:hypothetical protein n=1 Tax=Pseudomonas sp. REST10 TaxID=2512235 RepID=UPI00240D1517|nr:hypothetical protein [Pseudomonas sp. REST10]
MAPPDGPHYEAWRCLRNQGRFKQLVEAAKEQDKKDNVQSENQWQTDYQEWSSEVELAERVLNSNPSAKLEAIKKLDRFSDISELGSELQFSIGDTGIIECSISVHGRKAIPNETKSLLQSGKLSVKKMPVSKFNELEQDYVCSCVLRVANELFSSLPETMVIITAEDLLLNTSTGHMEKAPILSVAISRDTLYQFNLYNIDPSDAMANFVHSMTFKKTAGFAPVERLDPAQFT